MINIIFPFDPRDYHGGETYNPAWAPIMDLKRKLSPLFDLKWPGWGCSVEPTANVMSFYSKTLGNFIRKQVLDPLEASLPAVLLAFDTPAGILCVIATRYFHLATEVRLRLLNAFAKAASEFNAVKILIGGALQPPGSSLFVQNQVTKMDMPFTFFNSGKLVLLTHDSQLSSAQFFEIGSKLGLDDAVMTVWTTQPDQQQPNDSADQTGQRESRAEQPTAPSSAGRQQPSDLANQTGPPLLDLVQQPHQRIVEKPTPPLRPATSLYDNFLASMEAALQQNPKGLEIIDYIENVCFKGKLLYMNEFGEPVETPVPLGVKMEELLRVCLG